MANPNVVELNDGNFDSEVSGSSIPVLVDFWAPWCGPCRMIAPLIDEIASETVGTYKIAKVNVDESPATASKYRINAIPALLIFSKGEKVDQITGLTAKAEILSKLQSAAL